MDLKSRVFIIDDDPIHQRIAQIMISKHNLFDEYFSYTDAQKALDFLEENKKNEETLPDVILLDLNMPVLDGWDFLETFETLIKEFKKNIRVFIVSSSVDEKDVLRSKSYVAVKGFISKPLSPDIIRSIIETN
ncbi:response regulator [Daejeonella sp.]|uniref:response regulator n=1 Tax=Daejeonella sp. TaxID=2805397 RepID=UPI0027318E32|nr:response regulator [Daejeonella sp.]MDP2413939.1 response regulator [Daejeonella sp.]